MPFFQKLQIIFPQFDVGLWGYFRPVAWLAGERAFLAAGDSAPDSVFPVGAVQGDLPDIMTFRFRPPQQLF